jgi:hypothetical protein
MKKKVAAPLQVEQHPGLKVPASVLATSIVRLGESYKALQASGLTERAIVLLLHDASGVGKPDIRKVLSGMESLQRLYLRKDRK